jgi:hypothetical protein
MPSRTAAAVDQAPPHLSKSEAPIALHKTLTRTAFTLKFRRFFAVAPIHILGRAAAH